jgi:hypothetical protein
VPKRSNDFQVVVFLIKKHLAGHATVTESHELTDASTGALREVDITIELEVAGHPVMISLECRSHRRKQTVSFVEEMHSKHLFLPTNSLVLVSSSGFTREAVARAAVHGIELVTPIELTDDQAGKIVNRLQSIWFKTLNTSITSVRARMAGSPHMDAGWYDVGPEVGVFYEDGIDAANLLMLASGILRTGDWRPAMRDVLEDVTHFTAGADPLIGKRDGVDVAVPVAGRSGDPSREDRRHRDGRHREGTGRGVPVEAPRLQRDAVLVRPLEAR